MNKSSFEKKSSPATEQSGKIVDQAKQAITHVASDVAGQAREQVSTQFDTRKDKAVETMDNVASAIRDTSDKLKGIGPLGDVAGRAADSIEKVADFFEDKQIGDVVRDVERFARREPALFIGAAFALGLIGGRFLKSSSPRSSASSSGGYDSAGYSAGDYGDYGRSESFLSDDDLEDDVASFRGQASTKPYGSPASSFSSDPQAVTPMKSSAAGSPTASSSSTSTSSSTPTTASTNGNSGQGSV